MNINIKHLKLYKKDLLRLFANLNGLKVVRGQNQSSVIKRMSVRFVRECIQKMWYSCIRLERYIIFSKQITIV